MLDKKGFLFTVTIFLILTYILLSVSVWVKSVEASESSYSEFYKESTVELAIEQITPAKLDNVSFIIMNRNLLRLDGWSADDPLVAGPSGDENMHIRAAMGELLLNGSASPSHFQGEAIPPEYNSSLTAWASNLNASLRSIGVYIDQFNVSDFALGQDGIDKVNYSFDMQLGIKDYTNTSAVTRTYHVANELDVDGLVDPALQRASEQNTKDSQKTVYRQFFFRTDLYPNQGSTSVKELSQGITEGQGWIYGPLALASGSASGVPSWQTIAISNRSNYILVGNFSDIMQVPYDEFAGYIVTSAAVLTPSCSNHNDESKTFKPVTYTGKTCDAGYDYSTGPDTGKPFVVAPGFNPADPTCRCAH